MPIRIAPAAVVPPIYFLIDAATRIPLGVAVSATVLVPLHALMPFMFVIIPAVLAVIVTFAVALMVAFPRRHDAG
jgi:hypothetical protein